jgi:hypothetical protein
MSIPALDQAAERLVPAFLLVMLLAGTPAHAQDRGYGKVRLQCDASASIVQVSDLNARQAGGKEGALQSTTVDWRTLMKMGPEKNLHGEPLRTGSNTAAHRCGLYTVSIKAGYLSPNPTGRSGAYEFAVVQVLMNGAAVVAPTALFQCEQSAAEFSGFGPCPQAWAQTIRVAWNPSAGKSKVTIHRAYEDKSYEERTVTDEFEVAADPRK